jgi:hypothetical protein
MSSDETMASTIIPQISLKDRVVSISKWWNVTDTTRNVSRCHLLMDMRSSENYDRRHLLCKTANLVAASLPIDVLKERSFELPARHVEFSVLVHPSDLDRAEEFLLGPRRNGQKRPFKPWNITKVLLDEDSLWTEANQLGILAPGDSSPEFPLPRLWQPDPMVENILLPILKDLSGQEGGEVWDLGSGAGRDLTFLAEELASTNKTLKFVGLDHRYNEKETRITTEFCERRGVSQTTSCKKLDCSKWELVKAEIENAKNLSAIYAVRFWKPALFHAAATASDTFRPGAILAMSNFCKPFEGASWDFDNPNEKVVLERNHLNNIFSENWDILHDEIALDPDYGRPMVQFVAKRKR